MLKSLSSWFSGRDSSSSRKSLAMNYTRDAFTLPTHSPTLTPPAPYIARTPSTDNFDTEAGTPSYTYPPPSNDESLNFMPSSPYDTPSRSGQQASLLPLHHTPLPPLQACPPLSNTWNRIRTWLLDEYAELGDTLNWGVPPEVLREVELTLGFPLPSSVRESYSVTDGQEAESLNGFAEGQSLFFGLTFLPLEEALEEWKLWRQVDDDPSTGSNNRLKESMHSIPPGYIRRDYSQRGWFPLLTDKAGNYLGVDLNPDELGSIGQVIVFGRDFDMKVVMWKAEGEGGWGRWLANFAEELEGGEGFELGGADSSEGSDDGLGYESYFFDGSGRNNGEGGATKSGGGLRLTGEYRGWPVLEAWADRSYRRWKDAGLIQDYTPLARQEKPLPEPQEDEPLVPLSTSTTPPPIEESNASTPVAKAYKITPAIDSLDMPSSDPLRLTTKLSNSIDPATVQTDGNATEDVSSSSFATPQLAASAPPAGLESVTDASSNPTHETKADADVQPQGSSISTNPEMHNVVSEVSMLSVPLFSKNTASPDDPNLTQSSVTPVAHSPPEDHRVQTADAVESAEIDVMPSIRLVGGGGIVGVIESHDADECDESETSSIKSDPQDAGQRKKTNAISGGLKKLGSLGGINTKRKKDEA